MKTIILIVSFLIAFSGNMLLQSQQIYFTKTGKVEFSSKTPIENIEAVNNEATSFLNATTGDLVFAVLIKSFRFQKALMEEHFNENYMESTKFPKADFKGKIANIEAIDLSKDGEYKVTVKGNLTMHGVTKPASADGVVTVKGGKISAKSTFVIKLSDYKIERPSVVANKISETINIQVQTAYELKK